MSCEDQACPPTDRCVTCRTGFDTQGNPIYPLLVLVGKYWRCPECKSSYGENPMGINTKKEG